MGIKIECDCAVGAFEMILTECEPDTYGQDGVATYECPGCRAKAYVTLHTEEEPDM